MNEQIDYAGVLQMFVHMGLDRIQMGNRRAAFDVFLEICFCFDTCVYEILKERVHVEISLCILTKNVQTILSNLHRIECIHYLYFTLVM